MARLAFKPDSSFFRKIAIGAVGARAVVADLEAHGHRVVELERGATDTKLWKDVKRKRVRIPDLLCRQCGLRIESRAKTKPDLSMSHSPNEAERAWDYGMVDDDYVAFPVCGPADDEYWSVGKLGNLSSYWHERSRVRWAPRPCINYFTVSGFRSTPHARSSTKGVTEGSETSIIWPATFSTRNGTVDSVTTSGVTIRRSGDGHRYTWRIRGGMIPRVDDNDHVDENQVILSTVAPVSPNDLQCGGSLPEGHIARLLASRERTQRFTAIKLARVRDDASFESSVAELHADAEEDVYIRLEGASYLAATCHQSAHELFDPFTTDLDEQTQLEAVIAIGEAGTDEAGELLCEILDTGSHPYYVRSAAAWSLSRCGNQLAQARLMRAFADVDHSIREEALDGLVTIGGPAIPLLLNGLRHDNSDVAAGCAEALRQHRYLSNDSVDQLAAHLSLADPPDWAVWLLGHLPREQVSAAIAELQDSAPSLHYAISLLWSFAESWIARTWESNPRFGEEVPNDREN
jgi:hypothetical protein